ncbi:hypothetical protein [Saccharothrix coeruleofusca]|uniref:Uncharacterized protein n=1 Tax=Saccharothrix coeruleofusca TaxID=33919 RepID=A0A918EBD5_9PSEU|nr:hypothetical protein [Saccharothrix coeruleofusca]GGP41316.1 hypothetical protein GCM10010185_10570 [Saccharothrix coeruleofusca]
MTDPFRFYRELHLADDPTYRAPQDAVDSWRELAEQVRVELARMGFPVTVLSAEMPESKPVGGHVLVHQMEPFGVTLDWHAPVRDSRSYIEKVLNQEQYGLIMYVSLATEVIIRAMLDVLKEAGFRVLIDHRERHSYLCRVLEPPRFPMV